MTLPTLLRIGWLNLKRDRVAQALTFLLPIIFFSIFALVFSSQSDPTARVEVAVVDEDDSPYSRQLVDALAGEGGLDVRRESNGQTLDRERAEALVRSGGVPVAVVLPTGLGAGPRLFVPEGTDQPTILVLADVSDPVAPQVVVGLLQKVAFTAAPDAMAVEGVAMLEKFGGPLTEAQRQSFETWQKFLGDDAAGGQPGDLALQPGLATEIVNVMQPEGTSERQGGLVAFYAAGIGVMFLLFSSAGAGGTLLEEEEGGTLSRLLGSRAGMTGVLAGKWIFLAVMGVAQLTVMFVWGALVFGLPLAEHVPGFVVMTVFTAAAAAAFGLVLATVSRSRAQLSGISTILILTMSALGGSMFPRFLMSETMQQVGLATFNAWALDGYLKVFWRSAPLVDLWPQVTVLAVLTIVFLFVARLFARRWERI